MVADDRRIEILCERIGCSETRMLEGILSAVILLLFVVVTYYLLIAM
jgi:hypothetical protein